MPTIFGLFSKRKFGVLAIAALIAGSLVAATPANAAACVVDGPTTFTSGSTSYSVVAIKAGDNCTWTVPSGVTSLGILAVGGGGGGSSRHGGGGSAGGFVENASVTVPSGVSLSITVGAGGAGGVSTVAQAGSSGTTTSITGTGFSGFSASGGPGGSFAGGATAPNGFTAGVGGGSWACTGDSSGYCGGGGAGSSANGENADNGGNNRAGNGGAGSTASIFNSTVASTLGIPTAFGGGGGGGADGGSTAGTASFGGGAGSVGPNPAGSATVNTGGGGGGSGYLNAGGQGTAGAGASGIVVIRWANLLGSVSLNGTNQYLNAGASNDWNIGTGDFTIEWFQYQTDTSTWPRVFSIGSYTGGGTDIGVSIETGRLYLWVEGSYPITYSLGANSNYFHKWVHFAISRTGGTLNLYYDGTRVASVANSTNINSEGKNLYIGSEGGNSGTFFPGYLTNFHYVTGTALYSGTTLTRPTSPISAVANSKLLLKFETSSGLLTDSSGTSKTVSNVATSLWDANNPFSTTVPNAPTLNSATAAPAGASLSVSIPSYNGGSPITSYEYQLDSGSWVNTGNTTLPIAISGLTIGQTYSVKVRAVNSVGASSESGSASFTAAKNAQTVTWSPSTTSASVLSGSITVSGAASTNGNGSLSYAVNSQGTTGCVYDSATRVLTYSAAGTCVVRASAASTSTYNAGTKDVSFTISRSAQTVTWAPTTSILSTDSPAAVSVQATALGSPTISYSVASQGNTGCSVDSSTGTITFSAVGTCTVRATAAQSTAYLTAYTDVAFVIAAPTAYTITYSYQSATGGNTDPDDVFTVGGSALVLPTPTRTSYIFSGWYSASTGGSKIGDGGDSYTPTSTKSIYARWVQRSLWNMGSSTKIGTITTVSGVGNSYSASSSGTSVSLTYQADALPASTVIDVYLLADTNRASQLITDTSSFVVNLVVAWKAADETVPSTASGKPIVMTITNPAIKRGQRIYALLGDTVTDLGVAAADGTATFELTDDPEIVIANTKPGSPTSVTGVAGSSKVTVSWSTPSSNGGASITGYTVTASNGSSCTSSTTSCEITGLTNGTAYTFTVTATNSVGTSSASSSSASVTPASSSSGSSGGSSSGGSGGSVITPPVAYVPSLPSKPTINQGAVSQIDGKSTEVKIRRDDANTSIVAEVGSLDFEVKIIAPTGSAILPQNLVLQGTKGDDVKFNGGGFAPNSEVKVYVFSTPTYLGTVSTNSAGDFTGQLKLPDSISAGQHTLQFGGYLPDGKVVTTSFVLLVSSKLISKKFTTFFAGGSVGLSVAAKAALKKALSSVSSKKALSILVVGFAQKTAYSGQDLYVAETRANNVAKYLKSIGKKIAISTKAISPATQTSAKARRAEVQFSWFN